MRPGYSGVVNGTDVNATAGKSRSRSHSRPRALLSTLQQQAQPKQPPQLALAPTVYPFAFPPYTYPGAYPYPSPVSYPGTYISSKSSSSKSRSKGGVAAATAAQPPLAAEVILSALAQSAVASLAAAAAATDRSRKGRKHSHSAVETAHKSKNNNDSKRRSRSKSKHHSSETATETGTETGTGTGTDTAAEAAAAAEAKVRAKSRARSQSRLEPPRRGDRGQRNHDRGQRLGDREHYVHQGHNVGNSSGHNSYHYDSNQQLMQQQQQFYPAGASADASYSATRAALSNAAGLPLFSYFTPPPAAHGHYAAHGLPSVTGAPSHFSNMPEFTTRPSTTAAHSHPNTVAPSYYPGLLAHSHSKKSAHSRIAPPNYDALVAAGIAGGHPAATASQRAQYRQQQLQQQQEQLKQQRQYQQLQPQFAYGSHNDHRYAVNSGTVGVPLQWSAGSALSAGTASTTSVSTNSDNRLNISGHSSNMSNIYISSRRSRHSLSPTAAGAPGYSSANHSVYGSNFLASENVNAGFGASVANSGASVANGGDSGGVSNPVFATPPNELAGSGAADWAGGAGSSASANGSGQQDAYFKSEKARLRDHERELRRRNHDRDREQPLGDREQSLGDREHRARRRRIHSDSHSRKHSRGHGNTGASASAGQTASATTEPNGFFAQHDVQLPPLLAAAAARNRAAAAANAARLQQLTQAYEARLQQQRAEAAEDPAIAGMERRRAEREQQRALRRQQERRSQDAVHTQQGHAIAGTGTGFGAAGGTGADAGALSRAEALSAVRAGAEQYELYLQQQQQQQQQLEQHVRTPVRARDVGVAASVVGSSKLSQAIALRTSHAQSRAPPFAQTGMTAIDVDTSAPAAVPLASALVTRDQADELDAEPATPPPPWPVIIVSSLQHEIPLDDAAPPLAPADGADSTGRSGDDTAAADAVRTDAGANAAANGFASASPGGGLSSAHASVLVRAHHALLHQQQQQATAAQLSRAHSGAHGQLAAHSHQAMPGDLHSAQLHPYIVTTNTNAKPNTSSSGVVTIPVPLMLPLPPFAAARPGTPPALRPLTGRALLSNAVSADINSHIHGVSGASVDASGGHSHSGYGGSVTSASASPMTIMVIPESLPVAVELPITTTTNSSDYSSDPNADAGSGDSGVSTSAATETNTDVNSSASRDHAADATTDSSGYSAGAGHSVIDGQNISFVTTIPDNVSASTGARTVANTTNNASFLSSTSASSSALSSASFVSSVSASSSTSAYPSSLSASSSSNDSSTHGGTHTNSAARPTVPGFVVVTAAEARAARVAATVAARARALLQLSPGTLATALPEWPEQFPAALAQYMLDFAPDGGSEDAAVGSASARASANASVPAGAINAIADGEEGSTRVNLHNIAAGGSLSSGNSNSTSSASEAATRALASALGDEASQTRLDVSFASGGSFHTDNSSTSIASGNEDARTRAVTPQGGATDDALEDFNDTSLLRLTGSELLGRVFAQFEALVRDKVVNEVQDSLNSMTVEYENTITELKEQLAHTAAAAAYDADTGAAAVGGSGGRRTSAGSNSVGLLLLQCLSAVLPELRKAHVRSSTTDRKSGRQSQRRNTRLNRQGVDSDDDGSDSASVLSDDNVRVLESNILRLLSRPSYRSTPTSLTSRPMTDADAAPHHAWSQLTSALAAAESTPDLGSAHADAAVAEVAHRVPAAQAALDAMRSDGPGDLPAGRGAAAAVEAALADWVLPPPLVLAAAALVASELSRSHGEAGGDGRSASASQSARGAAHWGLGPADLLAQVLLRLVVDKLNTDISRRNDRGDDSQQEPIELKSRGLGCSRCCASNYSEAVHDDCDCEERVRGVTSLVATIAHTGSIATASPAAAAEGLGVSLSDLPLHTVASVFALAQDCERASSARRARSARAVSAHHGVVSLAPRLLLLALHAQLFASASDAAADAAAHLRLAMAALARCERASDRGDRARVAELDAGVATDGGAALLLDAFGYEHNNHASHDTSLRKDNGSDRAASDPTSDGFEADVFAHQDAKDVLAYALAAVGAGSDAQFHRMHGQVNAWLSEFTGDHSKCNGEGVRVAGGDHVLSALGARNSRAMADDDSDENGGDTSNNNISRRSSSRSPARNNAGTRGNARSPGHRARNARPGAGTLDDFDTALSDIEAGDSDDARAGSSAAVNTSNGARCGAVAMTAIDRFKFADGESDMLLTPAATPAKPATAKVTMGVVAATPPSRRRDVTPASRGAAAVSQTTARARTPATFSGSRPATAASASVLVATPVTPVTRASSRTRICAGSSRANVGFDATPVGTVTPPNRVATVRSRRQLQQEQQHRSQQQSQQEQQQSQQPQQSQQLQRSQRRSQQRPHSVLLHGLTAGHALASPHNNDSISAVCTSSASDTVVAASPAANGNANDASAAEDAAAVSAPYILSTSPADLSLPI